MLAQNPKSVFDLYEWLPSYGETTVEVSTIAQSLVVAVAYELDSGLEGNRKLIFDGVSSFLISGVPGIELMRITYDAVEDTGAVVEFENSEAAVMLRETTPWKHVRHYQVYFLSTNKRLEVFAEQCRLE